MGHAESFASVKSSPLIIHLTLVAAKPWGFDWGRSSLHFRARYLTSRQHQGGNMYRINRMVKYLLVGILIFTSLCLQSAPASAYPSDLFDLALELDGVDDYAATPDDGDWLDLGSRDTDDDDLTIEAYFYVPNLTDSGVQFLIYKESSYQLYINYSNTVQDTIVLGLGFGPTIFLSASTNLAVGWHHAAGTYDQINPGNDAFGLHLDGSRIAYNDNSIDWPQGLPDTTSPLYVGSAAGTGYVSGWIEEVHLSSSVRYSDIPYAAGTYTPDSSTRALYHFDEVWGATSFPDSGDRAHTLSGHNGAKVGNPLGAATDPRQPGPTYMVTTTTATNDGFCSALNCSLLEAINEANANPAANAIELQAGEVYTLTQAAYIAPHFGYYAPSRRAFPPLTGTLTIHGNGATIRRHPSLNCTILRDSSDTVVEPGEFGFFIVSSGASLTLDHAALANACLDGDSQGDGGAILNQGTLTLDKVTFTNNKAFWTGGALYMAEDSLLTSDLGVFTNNEAYEGGAVGTCLGSDIQINNSTFTNNQAFDGGGIYNRGDFVGSGLTFTGNKANRGAGGGGGAIANMNGTVAIDGCTIQGGDANLGGGIYNYTSAMTVTNCELTGNFATAGGAIHSNADLTLSHSFITENAAEGSGGGLYLLSAATIDHVAVTENNADNGGGIWTYDHITINNSTISGNSATGDGGGIYVYTDRIDLNHVTITNNTADSDSSEPIPYKETGGGIFSRGTVTYVHMKNSILSGNIDLSSGGPDCYCDFISENYNLIGSLNGFSLLENLGTNDLIGRDPRIGPLQDNGGPTFSHTPLLFSPVVDVIPAGVNGCGTDFTVDQRGYVRPADAYGNGSTACDIGAVEANANSLINSFRVFLPLLQR